MGKKVLVIGQGGRENALVWKLAQSPEIEKLYAAPGNPGMSCYAECIPIAAQDEEKLLEFALKESIDLTVVGPEDPLMAGMVDLFNKHGLLVFGPTAAAARLEGSKVFSKNLMKKYNIPTAAYEVFTDYDSACTFARSFTDNGRRVVIKVDGLAAGKGVVVAENWEEAEQAISAAMVEKSFGEAGQAIIIEECLQGEEVSVFSLSDGQRTIFLVSAQDHKRVFDNDEGPNTGGMGAYINPPIYTAELQRRVEETIITPTIKAMDSEGCPFRGVLYTGLMITDDGPRVLEYNARFGDPETQVIMPVIQGDILPLFEGVARGNIEGLNVTVEAGACVCVVLASEGYPGNYEKGKVITGLDALDDNTIVFHSGTALQDGQLVTAGGRVMALSLKAASMSEALEQVYKEINKINFEGMHFRKDIGNRALKREEG
ncbi:MAG: phosphoribosylamine--glycine ligase [Syntrophomonadaceae bacterium]|nr:phosphoribosylamine--glycine ligase [Syntrophomonadaceae bacterium]